MGCKSYELKYYPKPPDSGDFWTDPFIPGLHGTLRDVLNFLVAFGPNDRYGGIVGVDDTVEGGNLPRASAPYPENGEWVTAKIYIFPDGFSVEAEGDQGYTRTETYAYDNSELSYVAIGFGDQHETKVEVDYIKGYYYEERPIAQFTADKTEGSCPLTVQFIDQSTGEITSWFWDFGDGETSTEQNPSHTYNSTGYFTVSLTVTGSGGSDTETKENYIHVTEVATYFYLTFPLKGLDPYNAPINAIFDHSMTSYYGKDEVVVAYTGEEGKKEYDYDPEFRTGYKQQNGQPFIINGNYTGGGAPQYLYYDGHPGIDYRASLGTPVYAPADGIASIPITDPVNGDPSKWNTLKIDHGNGYSTWYLHCSWRIVNPGESKEVKCGDKIAEVGDKGTPGVPHLHFEVRKDGVPFDPYGYIRPQYDPYKLTVNQNILVTNQKTWEFDLDQCAKGWSLYNIENYSINQGTLYIDPDYSDPYMVSPALAVDTSEYNTVKICMASNAPDGVGAVYFTTSESPDWGEDKKVDFTIINDGKYHEYSVFMGSNPYWAGTVIKIRIDPADYGTSGSSEDTIGFDYIRLTNQLMPTPDIKANGSDGPITLYQNDTLTITVSLNNNGITDNADWWLAADTPFGLYFYTFSGWVPYTEPAYQHALFYLPTYEVFSTPVSGLPAGTYTLYFGIDTVMDGDITWDSLYYDTVEVNITE